MEALVFIDAFIFLQCTSIHQLYISFIRDQSLGVSFFVLGPQRTLEALVRTEPAALSVLQGDEKADRCEGDRVGPGESRQDPQGSLVF